MTPYPTTISLSDPVGGRFTQVTETQSGPHGDTLNFTCLTPASAPRKPRRWRPVRAAQTPPTSVRSSPKTTSPSKWRRAMAVHSSADPGAGVGT